MINYLTIAPPINDTNTINAVIEIPAGTNEKWEVNHHTGALALEIRNDQPRIIKYLGYPGNYGMIPQTMLPKELGGDGDPLDVLVIGSPLNRGTIAKAKLIGVLKFLDNGEQDDKLIAVLPNSALGTINSLSELNTSFPGALDIIIIWFKNYKGPAEMTFQGIGSLKEAEHILNAAIKNYKKPQ